MAKKVNIPKKSLNLTKGISSTPHMTEWRGPLGDAARERQQDLAYLGRMKRLLRRSTHATLDGSKGRPFNVPDDNNEIREAMAREAKNPTMRKLSFKTPKKNPYGGNTL